MLDLNKSYEARFLGRQVLNGAVTSDLLCHLVHDLPESVQGGSRCTVQCNASGLTVNRVLNNTTGTGITSLKVPLRDILFCHVDKARPEVTVWVVRSKDEDRSDDNELGVVFERCRRTSMTTTASNHHPNTGSGQHVLQAYIYRCLNQTDAVGLFKVYNEINRQAKLDKYRRNGEKKDESGSGSADGVLMVGNHVHYKVPNATSNVVSSMDFDDDSDDDDDNDKVHVVPVVTILSPSVKSEVKKLNATTTTTTTTTAQVNGKVGSVPTRTRNERDLGSVSVTTTGNGHAEVQNGTSSPTWTSIVGNIANYRKSFRILRPRDKQVREAVLEELREKLRSRDDVGDTDNDHLSSNGNNKPTDGSGGSRNPGNRQRKPVKTISATDSEDHNIKTSSSSKSLHNPVFVASSSTTPTDMIATSPSSKSSGSFHFPWSNAVKKLVNKKRNNGLMITSTFKPIPFPSHQNTMWYNVPSKELQTTRTSASSKGKKSSKKGPAPSPPTSNGTSHSTHRGTDPYFYLPPLPMPSHEAAKSATNGQHSRNDNFIPIQSNTLSRTRLRSSGSAVDNVESSKQFKGPRRTVNRVIPVTTESFRVLEPGMSDEAKHLSYPTPHYFLTKANGYPQNNSFFNGYGGHSGSNKKKPHVVHGLNRSARTNNTKKRNPSVGNSTFYRTSSTGSHGSTSSDSGADNKLRSVMKKPRQTNDNSPPEQKKNVTFHAYATVQVLT